MKKDILIGTLLGDACIPKLYGRGKIYRISWEHSLEQRDYALWKAKNCLDNFSVYERNRSDSRTGNSYKSITIYSIKDDYKYYRELFYPEGKKIISLDILNQLTPLSIAVWFMDDGNLYYNGNNCHLTLSVNCFTLQEVDLIIDFFRKNFNLNFKKSQKAIRLTSVKEVVKFESFFSSYYHFSMNYKKLNNAKQDYKNKKNLMSR